MYVCLFAAVSGAGTVGKLFELAMPEMLESFACRAWLPNNEQQHVAGRPCDGGRATEASGFPIFRRDAYAIRAQPFYNGTIQRQ